MTAASDPKLESVVCTICGSDEFDVVIEDEEIEKYKMQMSQKKAMAMAAIVEGKKAEKVQSLTWNQLREMGGCDVSTPSSRSTRATVCAPKRSHAAWTTACSPSSA